MANESTAAPPDPNGERGHLLTLYQITFETLRHESNGICERFNIRVGLYVATFAGLGFLACSDYYPGTWRCCAFVLSFSGLLIGDSGPGSRGRTRRAAARSCNNGGVRQGPVRGPGHEA
jgi:hypothetical protein